MGAVPAHARALVGTMKDVERTTIDAALMGSRELAVRALSLHPLVPSVRVAREIFDGYRARLPAPGGASPAGRASTPPVPTGSPSPSPPRGSRRPRARARSASPRT